MQIAAIEQHPLFNMKPDSLETAASGFATMASTIRNSGGAIVSAWQPIGVHYRGPGDTQLFDTMTPVGTTSTTVGDDLDKAASAMRTFKVTADIVKTKMDRLKVDHAALAVKIGNHEPTPIYAPASTSTPYGQYAAPTGWSPGGSSYSGSSYPSGTSSTDPIGYRDVNWWDDESLRNENLRIIRELSDCLEQMHEAERVAINQIRGLNCMAPITSGAGGWDSGQYGVDQIADDAETPWGTASFDDESCGSAALSATGGLLKDVANITNLIGLGWGWDGTDLGFSADNLSESWGGLGALIGRNPQTGEFSLGFAGDTWGAGLKSIVAADRWADNPGAAFGQSVIGVGSLFIPGAGVIAKGGKASKLADVGGGPRGDLPDLGSFGPRVPDLDGRMPDFDSSDFDFDLDSDSMPDGATDAAPGTTRGDTDTSPIAPADQARIDSLQARIDSGHMPSWLEPMQRGTIFNIENWHRYPANEVYLKIRTEGVDGAPDTVRRTILDSYSPEEGIVSRKNTQLGDVQTRTALSYLDELAEKYPSGKDNVVIADVPTSQANPALASRIGEPLNGEMFLEVPVQNGPIPQAVLDRAALHEIQIRDVTGRVYE